MRKIKRSLKQKVMRRRVESMFSSGRWLEFSDGAMVRIAKIREFSIRLNNQRGAI